MGGRGVIIIFKSMYYVYLNITNNIRTWRETNLKQAQVQTRPEYSIKKLTHAQF